MTVPDGRLQESVPVSSAADAAALLPDDATVAVSGFGSVGYPKAVPLALARAARGGRELALTVLSGGTVGDEIDTELVEAGAVARRYPYQGTRAARERVNDGRIAFHDRHVSRLADEAGFGGLPRPDVALVEAVAVGEDWLVPSTSIGQTPAYVDHADRLIVEVNEAQPLELARFHDVYRPAAPPGRDSLALETVDERIGSPRVAFDPSKLVAVVETDRADATYEFRDPTPTDDAIAGNLRRFLAAELDRNPAFEEAVRLQFGVGSLGNALMGTLSTLAWGDRTVSYFGEVVQDGLLDMLDDGVLAAASATSLALSGDGQARLFDAVDRYADDVVLRPTDVSNNPGLIWQFGVVAVNSALEVDCYGNVNSTHVNGSHLLNGLGGSGDFNRNALLTITALPSTAADGDVSRIVPMTPHVDHTEHDVDVVVTDRGVADLRGLAPRERARELVAVAAPEFRPRLEEYLERAAEHGGHVPHDLETALDWHAEWRDRDG